MFIQKVRIVPRSIAKQEKGKRLTILRKEARQGTDKFQKSGKALKS